MTRRKSDSPVVSRCRFVSLVRLHSWRNLRQGVTRSLCCCCCTENSPGTYFPENYGHRRRPEELAGGDGNSWGSRSCPGESTLRSTSSWGFRSCSDIPFHHRGWTKVSSQSFFHVECYRLKRKKRNYKQTLKVFIIAGSVIIVNVSEC